MRGWSLSLGSRKYEGSACGRIGFIWMNDEAFDLKAAVDSYGFLLSVDMAFRIVSCLLFFASSQGEGLTSAKSLLSSGYSFY